MQYDYGRRDWCTSVYFSVDVVVKDTICLWLSAIKQTYVMMDEYCIMWMIQPENSRLDMYNCGNKSILSTIIQELNRWLPYIYQDNSLTFLFMNGEVAIYPVWINE
jgi:hypothetical protein